MKKQTKEKIKTSTDYAITIIIILAITAIIYIIYMMITKNSEQVSYTSVDAYSESSNCDVNNTTIEKLDFNINEIINNNTKIKKEEIIVEEVDLEYTTKYINNSDLPKGMIQVLQDGIDGKQEVYSKKIYEGEKLVEEEKIGNKVIKSSVNKIVAIGTGNYTNNYQVKVGDTLYVTSSLLAVRTDSNDKANKIISLNKGTEVKLLQIKDKWYKIQYQSYNGWAKAECLTYLNPNSENKGTNSSNQYNKQQLSTKLNFNMNLNQPSGLSLEQFKKIFENEPKDTKNVFKNNSQYFYYAEKQYNINGVFLAAVAIHESGWGNSAIASNKNNLFGYGAYDRSPYDSAYEFSDYSEGIDLLARVFVKYYLNPAGTKIYDGNIAIGTYYNGANLSGVNIKYATDKNWANGVYTWMEYLYNNL